jgi:release factor glutamine methyltransferase
MDKTSLLLNRDKALTDDQFSELQAAIEKRKTGLPVAYITGHREFFGYDFLVNPSVSLHKIIRSRFHLRMKLLPKQDFVCKK